MDEIVDTFNVQPDVGDDDAPGGVPMPFTSERRADDVPAAVDGSLYKKLTETSQQHGSECTGFALANAVNYLIRRSGLRSVLRAPAPAPDDRPFVWAADVSEEAVERVKAALPSVSARMMYEMAQVFDRAAYEEGSTLRGALLGWQRSGVATDDLWPYAADDEHGEVHGRMTVSRIANARKLKLVGAQESAFGQGGSYRRIARDADAAATAWDPEMVSPDDKRKLVEEDTQRQIDEQWVFTMKQALADERVLYVDAKVHEGWFRPFLPDADQKRPDFIDREHGDEEKGYHAFLIVGYDNNGFLVHNSWGERWGDDGYATLSYRDWKRYGRSVWAPEVGFGDDIPVPGAETETGAAKDAAPTNSAETAKQMWRHVVALDDQGRLSTETPYAATSASVRSLFYGFEQRTKGWRRRRLLVFADDGGMPTAQAVERLVPFCNQLMANEIYPIFLVWDAGWHDAMDDEMQLERLGPVDFSEVTNTTRRRERLTLDSDDDLGYWSYEYRVPYETLAVQLWRAVEQRSRAACASGGGARVLADKVAKKLEEMDFDLHIAAHGAGDFLLSELAPLLPPVTTGELWAPATPIGDFERTYGALLDDCRIQELTVTVLDDESERDDGIGNYGESILCLASNVLAIDDIDSFDRYNFAPSEDNESRTPDNPEFLRQIRRDPVPLLGLERWISGSASVKRRAGSVHVNVAAGNVTHQALRDALWEACIERVTGSTRWPYEPLAPLRADDPMAAVVAR